MYNEEETAKILDLGYLLDIDQTSWLGTVSVYPTDLGLGEVMLPIGRQTMQVMPKSWITKARGLKRSVTRSNGWLYSHSLRFEGGAYRFVLKGFAHMVAESLDVQALRIKRMYDEVHKNPKETESLARQVVSKNAPYLWNTISQYHKGSVLTDEWKSEMLDRVIKTRFPTKEHLASLGIRYRVYRVEDKYLDIGGTFQKPFPGNLKNAQSLSKMILGLPSVMHERVQKRIATTLKDHPHGGIYTLTLGNLEKDIIYYNALDPYKVMVETDRRFKELQQFLEVSDFKDFKLNKPLRHELANLLQEISRSLIGKGAKEHETTYGGLFTGG